MLLRTWPDWRARNVPKVRRGSERGSKKHAAAPAPGQRWRGREKGGGEGWTRGRAEGAPPPRTIASLLGAATAKTLAGPSKRSLRASAAKHSGQWKGHPRGATKRAKGAQPLRAGATAGTFGEAPCGATKHARGTQIPRAPLLIGAFAGTPYGVAMRARGARVPHAPSLPPSSVSSPFPPAPPSPPPSHGPPSPALHTLPSITLPPNSCTPLIPPSLPLPLSFRLLLLPLLLLVLLFLPHPSPPPCKAPANSACENEAFWGRLRK